MNNPFSGLLTAKKRLAGAREGRAHAADRHFLPARAAYRLNGYLEELFFLRFREILESGGESWTSASLLDIADYKNGLAMQKYRPSKGDPGLPVLKIRELGQGYCGNDSERCATDIDGSVMIDDGDLVFSWSGTLLLRFWAGGRAGLNQHLFKVTSKQYPSWFYYAWTKHHLARFVMLAKDRATTMGHIKRSALAESSVAVPPARILEQQTKLMQPIVDEIVSNMAENRKLALLRDALLPKLMSGEIDVSKVDLTQLNSHLVPPMRDDATRAPLHAILARFAISRIPSSQPCIKPFDNPI